PSCCWLCSVPFGGLSLPFWLFFFHDPATPEIYTLSLHDALPISRRERAVSVAAAVARRRALCAGDRHRRNPRAACHPEDSFDVEDRKSTRLNSSHVEISYAVFCLKKKTNARSVKPTNPRHTGPTQ